MNFSPADAALLVRRNGGTDAEAIFLASVVPGESGGNPEIINRSSTCGPKGERAVGLFQICSFASRGTVAQLQDPDYNAREALKILRSQGERAWTAEPDSDAAEEARQALAGGRPVGNVDMVRTAIAHPIMKGAKIIWVEGWEARSTRDSVDIDFDPHGVVCHHTAGARPAAGDYPSLATVRDGRSDLAGPLSQFGLGYSGTIYVIAAGRANHAGPGGWKGLSGNGSVWGVEAENPGTPTGTTRPEQLNVPWTSEQLKWYPRLCAALAAVTPFEAEMVCFHREWNPIDKPDPSGLDADTFRAQVAEILSSTQSDQKEDEDEMKILRGPAEGGNPQPLYMLSGFAVKHIESWDSYMSLIQKGVIPGPAGTWTDVTSVELAEFVLVP